LDIGFRIFDAFDDTVLQTIKNDGGTKDFLKYRKKKIDPFLQESRVDGHMLS